MKFSMPIALCFCLVFSGCVFTDPETSRTFQVELQVECKAPRNDEHDPLTPPTVFGVGEDRWPGLNQISCYDVSSVAAYCNADKSDCAQALVYNEIQIQIEQANPEAFRVHGTFESRYGPSIQVRSSSAGMTTKTSDTLPEEIKVLDMGRQAISFDVTLGLDEPYFVSGFAESGATISVVRLPF